MRSFFSSEYIANILEQRQRLAPQPAPLHLTRRAELLDVDLGPADLSPYIVLRLVLRLRLTASLSDFSSFIHRLTFARERDDATASKVAPTHP